MQGTGYRFHSFSLLVPLIIGTLSGIPYPGFALQQNKSFIYLVSAGRKYIKETESSEYIIELYHLPGAAIKMIRKLPAGLPHDSRKANGKTRQFLATFKDSIKVFRVSNTLKYKQFYPLGLKPGDYIQEMEYAAWDFVSDSLIVPKKNRTTKEIDMVTLFQDISLDSLLRPNIKPCIMTNQNPQIKEIDYFPWRSSEDLYTSHFFHPSFDLFIDSLFNGLDHFSPYLGVQRLRFELFDNPVLASFYSRIYIHYIDSICSILKDSLTGRGKNTERFIRAISSIILERFDYRANFLLWQGICDEMLDCDNSSYLVYDIGKKLGFDISIVVLPYHALVIIDKYAYETTGSKFYPKEQLSNKYPNIFLISADPVKINADVAVFELSNYLLDHSQDNKALSLLKISLKYFSNDPVLLFTLGRVYSRMHDHLRAFLTFKHARHLLPDDLNINYCYNTELSALIKLNNGKLISDLLKN